MDRRERTENTTPKCPIRFARSWSRQQFYRPWTNTLFTFIRVFVVASPTQSFVIVGVVNIKSLFAELSAVPPSQSARFCKYFAPPRTAYAILGSTNAHTVLRGRVGGERQG